MTATIVPRRTGLARACLRVCVQGSKVDTCLPFARCPRWTRVYLSRGVQGGHVSTFRAVSKVDTCLPFVVNPRPLHAAQRGPPP